MSQAGTGRRTAYALAIFPLDVVHRATIRAMLPAGQTGSYRTSAQMRRKSLTGNRGSVNRTSVKFQDALRDFARLNWIDRGQQFLRIRERGALLDFAMADLDQVPHQFICLDDAIAEVKRVIQQDIEPPPSVEQRRQELLALQRLMAAHVGGVHWSGRGSVCFVNKGQAF